MAKMPSGQQKKECGERTESIIATVENSMLCLALAGRLTVHVSERQNAISRAKDRLPVCCHEEVDYILRRSTISPLAFWWAVKCMAIGHKDGRLARINATIDCVCASVILSVLIVIMLSLVAILLARPGQQASMAWVAPYSLLPIMGVTAYLFVWPQRVAKQAMLVMKLKERRAISRNK